MWRDAIVGFSKCHCKYDNSREDDYFGQCFPRVRVTLPCTSSMASLTSHRYWRNWANIRPTAHAFILTSWLRSTKTCYVRSSRSPTNPCKRNTPF